MHTLQEHWQHACSLVTGMLIGGFVGKLLSIYFTAAPLTVTFNVAEWALYFFTFMGTTVGLRMIAERLPEKWQ